MSDEKQPDDFDDLDFDDFDDLDIGEDFDEPWDDLDEEDEKQAPNEPVSAPPKSVATQSGERTFLQKNFNTIVIGAAIFIGAGVLLSQFGGGQQQSAPTPVAVNPEEQVALESAPMPLPGETAEVESSKEQNENVDLLPSENLENAENTDLTDSAAISDGSVSDVGAPTDASDVLTPMPDLADETDLADLGLPLEEDDLDAMLNAEAENQEMALVEPVESEEVQEDTQIADQGAILEVSETEELGLEEELAALENEQADESENILDFEAMNEPVETADTSAPDVSVVDMEAVKADFEELNAVISEKDQKLEDAMDAQNDLSAQLDTSKTRVMELEAEVAALKEEIETLKTATSAKSVTAQPKTASVPKEAASVSQTSSKPKPTQTAKPKPILYTPQWVLRAAQPGQATLSDKNGDLRYVAVGDTVSGLGKILSISPENGRWVVRGTKGSVSQ